MNAKNQIVDALKNIEIEPAFFGVISFHFQNGKLTVVKKEQTLKVIQENHSNANNH